MKKALNVSVSHGKYVLINTGQLQPNQGWCQADSQGWAGAYRQRWELEARDTEGINALFTVEYK